jgi:hypothetical protein
MIDRDEFKVATVLAGGSLPKALLRFDEVMRRVVMLDGSTVRDNDIEPGGKTLRLGLQQIDDFAVGVRSSVAANGYGFCAL